MTDREFVYDQNDLDACASWYNKKDYERKTTKDGDRNSLNRWFGGSCLKLFLEHGNHYRRNMEGLSQEEMQIRLMQFTSNVAFLVSHNSNMESSRHEVGLNQFSDLQDEELPFMMEEDGTGLKQDKGGISPQYLSVESLAANKIVMGESLEGKKNNKNKWAVSGDRLEEGDKFEEFLDWSSTSNPDRVSIVHESRDQGSCGSCWAFASTGTVEASISRNVAFDTYALSFREQFGKYPMHKANNMALSAAKIAEQQVMLMANLSVQELIDCDTEHDFGCVGGNPISSFYFINKFGLANASTYPYTGQQSVCNTYARAKPIATVQSWGILTPNHENNMLLVLRYVGPLAVGFNANDHAFTSYKSGIYNSTDCSQQANHALLIVGYGEQLTQKNILVKYWIARNSWGKGWGENGYVRIARGNGRKEQPGLCGIAQIPSIAIGASLLVPTPHPNIHLPQKLIPPRIHSNQSLIHSQVKYSLSRQVFLQYSVVIFIVSTIIFLMSFLNRRHRRRFFPSLSSSEEVRSLMLHHASNCYYGSQQ